MTRRKGVSAKYRRKTFEDYFREDIGKTSGRLTVYGIASYYPKQLRVLCYSCICQCGNTLLITPTNFNSGNSSSCGCFKKEDLSTRKRTHEQSHNNSRLYRVWVTARSRCNNPNFPKYKNYGAKGVKMHPDFDDFEVYEAYLRSLYPNLDELLAKKYQVDRYPAKLGDYTYGNMRVVSPKVNSNNRTNNRYVTVYGEELTIAQAWEKYPIVRDQTQIVGRLNRGWSDMDAVLIPALPSLGSTSFFKWREVNLQPWD